MSDPDCPYDHCDGTLTKDGANEFTEPALHGGERKVIEYEVSCENGHSFIC